MGIPGEKDYCFLSINSSLFMLSCLVSLIFYRATEAAVAEIESSRELSEIEPRFGLSLIHTITETLTAISTIFTTTQVKSVFLTCTPLDLGLSSGLRL